MTNRKKKPYLKALLAKLFTLCMDFGDAKAKQKLDLLQKISGLDFRNYADLINYHELLLFMCAYPDTKSILLIAKSELKRVSKIVDKQPFALQKVFNDSGIANTFLTWKPSLDMCSWLLKKFPESVKMEWDGTMSEQLENFLPILSDKFLHDGLQDDTFTTRTWVNLAGGMNNGSSSKDLSWIVSRFLNCSQSYLIRDHLFDSLSLNVRWKLNHPLASRTLHFLDTINIYFQDNLLQKHINLNEIIQLPLKENKVLRGADAQRLIDSAKSVLAVRKRETDPVSYADINSCRMISVERGLDIAILGMDPERRMPLESYFGYIAYKNGVPVGYGGGWIFLERCEIGINIFETFRGGENNFIFANLLRVYHQQFKVTRFVVQPYQFGADNKEGLQSGAFWFYYRFGFRPLDNTTNKLATAEFEKLKKNSSYRTSLKTLTLLASCPVELIIGPEAERIEPKEFSILITEWVGRNFMGDGKAAIAWSSKQLLKILNIEDMKKWTPDEKKSFRSLSPLFMLIHDLNAWSLKEKNDCISILKNKGNNEMEYTLLFKNHKKLRKSFQTLILNHTKNEKR